MVVNDVIWSPPLDLVERANVTRLSQRLGCVDYHELHRVSVEEPERFWPAVVDDLALEFSRPWDAVVDASDGPEWAKWFVGGRVSIARACVHDWARRTPSAPAAVLRGEDGKRRELTFAELSLEVTRLAEALAALGIEPGDRVAIFMPMSPAAADAST